MKRLAAFVLMGTALLTAGITEAADSPATWDGLVEVPSDRLDVVFLQPGADFRGYTKVLLDPTEVAFKKDWQRDYNRSTTSLSGRVNDRDVERAIAQGVSTAGDIFAEAWSEGGYSVVTTPGEDVLRVRTGLLDVSVAAPDTGGAGRSYTFTAEAGAATFFVEVRDSVTGALLGRAVDRRWVGENTTAWRTRVSNRADFRREVRRWAEISVRGMNELKALSPVS